MSKHTQSSCCIRPRSAIRNVAGAADEMGTHDLCDANYLHMLSQELHMVLSSIDICPFLKVLLVEFTQLNSIAAWFLLKRGH